jgi:hypothetical protein
VVKARTRLFAELVKTRFVENLVETAVERVAGSRWQLASIDDGTLSSEEAQEKQRQLGLRWGHIGLSLPGQLLRLDLYRLVCYFQTSEYLANLSDGGDFCPWQGLRDEFQDSEIVRILLQTAVAVRFIGGGHADEMRAQKDWLEDSVGRLYKMVGDAASQPLPLREACNKIIHAKNIVLESNESRNPYKHFIKPTIFRFGDLRQQTGWKAEIDVFPFVELCNALALQFRNSIRFLFAPSAKLSPCRNSCAR